MEIFINEQFARHGRAYNYIMSYEEMAMRYFAGRYGIALPEPVICDD